MKVSILNVLIDNLSKTEALNKVQSFLHDNKQHLIVTPNPEFVLKARKDKQFQDILNRADLSIPDGVGLLWASRILGCPIKQRITGVDLMIEICKLAAEQGKSVFLLGAAPPSLKLRGAGKGIAQETAEVLKKQYPQLKIVGAMSGGKIECLGARLLNIIKNINRVAPDILFVAFGQVRQEKWIAANLKNLPSVKITMGVGGSFDYISGRVKRAPYFLRYLGLEWLFRLIRQPWRIRRIFRAVLVFPLLVVYKSIFQKV